MRQFVIRFRRALPVVSTIVFVAATGGAAHSQSAQPEVSCEARFEGLRTHISRMENDLKETQTALEVCRRPPPSRGQIIAELQSLEQSIETRFARVQQLLEKLGR